MSTVNDPSKATTALRDDVELLITRACRGLRKQPGYGREIPSFPSAAAGMHKSAQCARRLSTACALRAFVRGAS